MDATRRTSLLVAWNVLLTIAVALLAVAWRRPVSPRFTQISVERIDVVDSDGTRRMSITNRERLPNIVIDGKEAPRENRSVQPAGILLYDEEGNEAGGLATTSLPNGAKSSMLVLDYGRSEAIGLVQHRTADGYQAALILNAPADKPDAGAQQRISLSTAARVSSIELSDSRSRPRIRLSVDANDKPSIAVLDEAGAVVSRLPE